MIGRNFLAHLKCYNIQKCVFVMDQCYIIISNIFILQILDNENLIPKLTSNIGKRKKIFNVKGKL